MKTLCQLSIVTAILMIFTLPAIADDDCFALDDVNRVAFKNGYAHDFMQMARDYFEEHGECPSPYWLAREIKLHVQRPEMFGGKPLEIYEMATSSGGVPEDMSREERDDYIFYYGGPTGLVSVEIFDSVVGIHYASIVTDSKNMAQSAEAAEHHVYHMFKMFAREILEGGDPAELIEQYARDLAIAPNDEAKEHLITAFRRGLRSFGQQVRSGSDDPSVYAYELGRLRAAVWSEYQDARDKKMFRTLKYGY